jgi:hypothetical protein
MSITWLLENADTVGEPREGPRKFWTGRETMILRNAYPEGGIQACLAKLPGRSPSAIYQYALRLKLRSPRGGPHALPAKTNDYIDGMIRRTYQNNPDRNAIKNLARTIDRSRQWIRTRAIKLGIAVPRFKEPPWDAAENEIVLEAAHLDPVTLQRRLAKAGFQRTQVAIVGQITRQGVTREDPDHYTANGLAKLFGIDVHVVTGWIDKGWLYAQRRGTARVAEQGGDQWWIHRRSVRKFVADSVQVIDFRKVDKVWLVELMTDKDTKPLVWGEGRSHGTHRPGVFRPGVFMPVPKPAKCRLDQEEAREMVQEVAHWLNDLNEIDTERVFTEMRRQNQWMKLKSKALGGKGIPVGAADFDDVMQAEVRRDFLAAVRDGRTPEDAAETAKALAEGYVAKHNAKRPDDINWQRTLGAYAGIADLLVVSMRGVLSNPT